MGDNWGKTLILLLAIGFILLGTSGKGKVIWGIIRGKSPAASSNPQSPNNSGKPNPTDYSKAGDFYFQTG